MCTATIYSGDWADAPSSMYEVSLDVIGTLNTIVCFSEKRYVVATVTAEQNDPVNMDDA